MRSLFALWFAWSAAYWSWQPTASAAEPTRPPVVLCSFAPLASWAANVAGDLATVDSLLPGDVGPHDFQFRPRDLRRIQSADLIVVNGLGIEDWLERALRANAREVERKLIRTSDGLKTEFIYHVPELEVPNQPGPARGKAEHGHSHDHDHAAAGEQPNPHVWLDPVFARHGVSNILEGLIRVDPTHAEGYRRNAAAYLLRLQNLDAEVRARIAKLSRKQLVTFHDAFPYFTRRYGLELVGVLEEVPGVDPSPRYIASLLGVIRARQVGAIFTEAQFSPRLARRLAKDLGIAVAELDVLETGKPTLNFYEDGIRRNIAVLEQHLK